MVSNQIKSKLVAVLEHKNYKIAGDTLIIHPDNVNMLGSVIRVSNRFGIKIIPIGSGSTYSADYQPPEGTVFLSTRMLNSMISFDKANMFAEVQAGCRWKDILGVLDAEGLCFPLDRDSVDEKRTAGGIFSTIRPDSAASNYFTAIEFFTSDGTLIRYGCKTLKNVAGYDLIKFMAGSCGRFGVLASLTLRLLPSDKMFFAFEKINEISCDGKKIKNNRIFEMLKKELDPNSVFN